MGTASSKQEKTVSLKGLSPTFSSLLHATSTTQCADDAQLAPPPLPDGGSSAPPPPPTADKAAVPPPPDAIEEAAQMASAVQNPGPYEQASMDAKRLVSLDTFDGMRFDINKQLSPYMAVVHSFWLGTSMIPDGRTRTYTFLTQVADEAGLLMARVDFDRGSVDGRIHRALLGGAAMAKVQMSLSQEGQQDQCLAEVDIGGDTWTSNLKYGTMGGGLMFGCNFFQSITPKLQMGGEGMYIAANQNLLSNYTLKYTMPAKAGDEEDAVVEVPKKADPRMGPLEPPSSCLCANFSAGQGILTFNYKRVVTPNRVTLGAELQCSPVSLDSQVLVGAEFKLSRSKMQFCVDGSGRIQSILEAKLGQGQGAPTLSFAAEVDHPKEVMRFGYGLNIEG